MELVLPELLDALGQGVVAIGLDGVVLYANASAARLFGWPVDELVGRPVLELATALPPSTAIAVDPILDRLRAGETWRGELSLVRRGGVPFLAGVVATPIADEGGELTAILALCEDLTDRRLVDEELTSSRERLRLALDAARMGTFRWDAATGLVEWDEQLEAVFGLPPGGFAGTFDAWIELVHPDDREAVMAVIADAVARTGQYLLEHRTVHGDGSVHWIEGRGRAVADDEGRVIGTIGVAVDVTERKQSEQTTRSLHELGLAFASELDLDLLVQAVTDAAVGATGAAFGAFFYNVVGAHGEAYTLYAIAGADRERFSGFPMPRNTPVFAPTFNGEAVVRSDDITADPRYGQNPPYHGMPEGHLAVRSYLAAAVVSRSGEVLGGLFLGHPEPAMFDDRREALLLGIAAQAAVAIDNARLFAHRSDVAETLQRSLLPPALPDIPGVRLAARYHPAGTGLDVGGDFYDVFAVDDEWAVMIGDVSGTGAAAAALTAVVRHTARAVASHVRRPSAVVRAVNDAILALEHSERFCTMAYGHLRPRAQSAGLDLEIVSAGHPPALVRRVSGDVEEVRSEGAILGQLTEIDVVSTVVTLDPGDTVVFYTDGVIEARERERGGFFGEEGLLDALRSTTAADAAATAAAIEQAVLRFIGGRPSDDVALLVVQA